VSCFDQTARRDAARLGARQYRRESFPRTALHRYAARSDAGHFEIGAKKRPSAGGAETEPRFKFRKIQPIVER
jgi:hypothetical protein